MKSLSRVRLLATPWTAAHQAPPSMGLSRQEQWSGVPSPIHLVHCKVAKGREKGWQLNLRIKRSHKDFKLNILTFKLDWLEMTYFKERIQPKIYRLILVRT